MSGLQLDSMMAAGNSAAATVATALVPKRHTAPAATQQATGTRATAHASAAATGGSGTASSATAQTITSSDFLTLLVSELKNQDPTQPTDPNAYISQLVGVNSLQQLISINSGVSTLDGTVTAPTKTTPATLAVTAQ